jgi:hypothetical protein
VQWGLISIYVKYTVTGGVYPFSFILREPYSPNGNSHLNHNASIDADFLKEVPFGDVEICKENCRGHICPQKLRKKFNHCTGMKFLNNF